MEIVVEANPELVISFSRTTNFLDSNIAMHLVVFDGLPSEYTLQFCNFGAVKCYRLPDKVIMPVFVCGIVIRRVQLINDFTGKTASAELNTCSFALINDKLIKHILR